MLKNFLSSLNYMIESILGYLRSYNDYKKIFDKLKLNYWNP